MTVIFPYMVGVLVFLVMIAVPLIAEIWANRDNKLWKKAVMYVALVVFLIPSPMVGMFVTGQLLPEPKPQENWLTDMRDRLEANKEAEQQAQLEEEQRIADEAEKD